MWLFTSNKLESSVPDTVSPDAAAGQPVNSDTEGAEQILADAATAPEEQAKPVSPWEDPEAAKKEIEKLRKEAAANRVKLKELTPLAQKQQEAEDANKSETQKLSDQLAALQKEHTDTVARNTRLLAAAEFNIPADLIDLLGTGTEEEIRANAELLANKLKPAVSNRPVEALSPGAAPKDDQIDRNDPNAWLRKMARGD